MSECATGGQIRMAEVLTLKKLIGGVLAVAVFVCAAMYAFASINFGREFPIDGKNVSDIDTQRVVKKIADVKHLEDGSELCVNSDNFDLTLSADFDWEDDGAIRFFYTKKQATYSAQLRMFHEDNKYYIDCFDDDYIYHFDEGLNEIKPPTKHYFGICPVGVAELNNGIADTIYNSIKDLQDSYESTLSDWSNEIADTRLAYMLITGMTLEDEVAKQMKSMGILQCPDPDGKVEWLVKNIPSDFIKSYREILEEEMYKVTHHLKNQVTVQSNTSGAMLATRLNCLRIKLTTIHQCLNNCIKTRLRCLFKYLNILDGTDYNYKDVSIKFTLNLPNNDLEMAQILSQLTGKLSIRTGLSQLSFVTNAEEEYKKMMEEQEQALGELDLDVIKDETEQISA